VFTGFGPRGTGSQRGAALVLVLMLTALITAMVVEFVDEVFTANAALYNWKDARRLSLIARSGVSLQIRMITDTQQRQSYTYPGVTEMPVARPTENFSGTVTVRAEDENAKFNLNALVSPNGTFNTTAYETFKRLLRRLALNERIADRVADWIDPDREPILPDSEDNAKNAYMDSLDELFLIIDDASCSRLLPYVTAYGIGGINGSIININTASVDVLIALDDAMTEELAERIVTFRTLEPFKGISDIVKVAGFEGTLGQSLMGRIAVKAANFRITSVAEENRVKRMIECVAGKSGDGFIVKYWKET
jgi:general secretion pathway protein K